MVSALMDSTLSTPDAMCSDTPGKVSGESVQTPGHIVSPGFLRLAQPSAFHTSHVHLYSFRAFLPTFQISFV